MYIENKHGAIRRHPCNKCEYATTTAHQLRKHENAYKVNTNQEIYRSGHIPIQ